MARYFYITLLAVTLVSCGAGRKESLQAIARADSLELVMARQDTVLNTVFTSLNEVMENLQTIKERENIITRAVSGDGESHHYALHRIPADIDALDSLLLVNRRTITQLHGNVRELKSTSLKVSALEKLIEVLSDRVNSNDNEVSDLRRELSERNMQVRSLSNEVDGLSKRGNELETEVRETGALLNMAYYRSDLQKTLLREGVVYKTGLIGRTLKVNENRSLESFTKIDIRTFDRLRIEGASPVLLSAHPDDSYEFVRDKSGLLWLAILDKSSFWKYTRVLVVSYK